MRKIAVLLLPLFFWGHGLALAKSEKITTNNFVITYENILPEMAQQFAEQAEKAFGDVTAYLSKKYRRGRIYIYISNKYDMPRTTKDNELLIPANRVRGDAGGPPEIAGRGPAIVHELTHVITPSQGKPNRYLDEGLAVFMQEKFGVDKSYPNMGEDVHQVTLKLIKTVGQTVSIYKLEETRNSSLGGDLRHLAYLQEGSFVRYLIEKYGLQDFMAMYEGKSYEKVYEKSLDDLEKEWKEFIRGIE
jgi:hypothetical protein